MHKRNLPDIERRRLARAEYKRNYNQMRKAWIAWRNSLTPEQLHEYSLQWEAERQERDAGKLRLVALWVEFMDWRRRRDQ